VIGVMITRDLRRAIGGAAWLPVAFFLVVATLVPFAVGPDPRLLERIAAGGLWIAALTAALLPIERLIEPDRANGVLDQLAIRGVSEEAVGAAKVAAHWLTFGPLLLAAALPSSLILGIAPALLNQTLVALAVGTPALAALAVMVAALTAGLPRAGALAGVLLLPLAVPLLIFGAGAAGDAASGALLLEAAVSLLLVAVSPFVIGGAIRASRT
jgi:heme exporter protein B